MEFIALTGSDETFSADTEEFGKYAIKRAEICSFRSVSANHQNEQTEIMLKNKEKFLVRESFEEVMELMNLKSICLKVEYESQQQHFENSAF